MSHIALTAAAKDLSWRGSRPIGWTRITLLAALFAFALVPVLTTPIPAMVDYVNHLARMYVMASAGTPQASPFYHVTSAFYPNLAMDLVVPRLARLTGVELATRLFLLCAQVLVVTGAMAIELVVKRRLDIAGFVALLMLYSVPFAWGFLNFEFALGLALWGIAAWLALRERAWPMRLAVHSVAVGLLLTSHMFAFGIYGFVLGVLETWAAREHRATTREMLATLALLSAPALVALAFLAWSGGHIGRATNVWYLIGKPLWLFLVLNGVNSRLSIVGSSFLAMLVYHLVSHRALRLDGPGTWILWGLGLLYLAVPSRFLDTAFVDIRVLVAAALILPAFTTISFPSGRSHLAAAAIVVGLILASSASTLALYRSYGTTYEEMIASFSRLDKGKRVLVATSGPADDPPLRHLADYPLYHAPTLAVHYADALVPTLFTTVGKQPIAVRAGDQRLSYSCGGPVPMAKLVAVARGTPIEDTPGFVRSWASDFDYVYVLGAPAADPLPALLAPLLVTPRFTLYRVQKDQTTARTDQRRPPSLLKG